MTRDALSLKICLDSLRRVPVTLHNGTGWCLPCEAPGPEPPDRDLLDRPPWPPSRRGCAAELVSLLHGSCEGRPRGPRRCSQRRRGYRWWSVPASSSSLRCNAGLRSWQRRRSECALQGSLQWSAFWFLSLPWSF